MTDIKKIYAKESIAYFVGLLKQVDPNVRVFISETGTYGLVTDTGGTSIIYFQEELLSISISGRYEASMNDKRRIGNGWRIDSENLDYLETAKKAVTSIRAPAPRWATDGCVYRLATLEDELNKFGRRDRYIELTDGVELTTNRSEVS